MDRKSVPAPASLVDKDGAGARELAKATKHYLDPKAETYGFKAYKRPDVKQSLRDLFKKKCAYCESFHESTSSADIEHYRPKASVDGEPGHRGYWWLAADWNNLLRSCIGCNRIEGHRVAAAGMTAGQLAAQKVQSVGKGDAFPVLAARAFEPDDDCDGEDPLLIDPTRRDPGPHLAWHTRNDLSLLSPGFQGAVADAYGEHTIRIMALNRQALVEARTRHLQRLNDLLFDIEEALAEAAVAVPAQRARPLRRVARKRAQLHAMADAGEEFTAMTRAFVTAAERDLLARYRQWLEAKAEPADAVGA
ncbi:hypothetical protein [Lysobacter sp. CA196]|uniref:hypothetical protein n=1 Tax=Lysobacter sp. CA196 TaxID=3455606 RepID=UPI003F8D61BE